MSTFNYIPHDDGDTIDASDLNIPFGQVADVLNGNVDQDNLAVDAVSTAKLQNEAVTSEKIAPEGVQTSNIQDHAVTTDKIADNNVTTITVADDAITDAKLIYGKVHKRQGGHSVNFNSTGTTNYDVTGNIKVQMGTCTTAAGELTVTFPEAFSNIPFVMISQASANSFNGYSRFKISLCTTTQIGGILFFDTSGNVRANEQVNWIAIGQA